MGGDKENSTPLNAIFSILKGAIIASIVIVVLLVLYAMSLEKLWLPVESVEYVPYVLKILGAALAARIAIKKCMNKRWLIGVGAGIAFATIAFMSFSIISDTFQLSVSILFDMIICAVSGAVVSIILGFKR